MLRNPLSRMDGKDIGNLSLRVFPYFAVFSASACRTGKRVIAHIGLPRAAADPATICRTGNETGT
ncbi:hypothetical protein WG901_12700 [Novosphingobium sp. PS1R-30]|uniref:Uncharacterized protein n=1 Tax=Novosphingobium anseongense TaxID=3133436 RepID=A0ABU8RWN7_9SPHN